MAHVAIYQEQDGESNPLLLDEGNKTVRYVTKKNLTVHPPGGGSSNIGSFRSSFGDLRAEPHTGKDHHRGKVGAI